MRFSRETGQIIPSPAHRCFRNNSAGLSARHGEIYYRKKKGRRGIDVMPQRASDSLASEALTYRQLIACAVLLSRWSGFRYQLWRAVDTHQPVVRRRAAGEGGADAIPV